MFIAILDGHYSESPINDSNGVNLNSFSWLVVILKEETQAIAKSRHNVKITNVYSCYAFIFLVLLIFTNFAKVCLKC